MPFMDEDLLRIIWRPPSPINIVSALPSRGTDSSEPEALALPILHA